MVRSADRMQRKTKWSIASRCIHTVLRAYLPNFLIQTLKDNIANTTGVDIDNIHNNRIHTMGTLAIHPKKGQ